MVRFIPGIDTIAQPLVGVAGMPVGQYLMLTALGAVVWSGTLLGLGYAFGTAAASQHSIDGLHLCRRRPGVALVGYIIWKVHRRIRQLEALKLPRIDATELKNRLDAGEPLVIIDLRHPLEVRFHPVTIPGAKRFNRQDAAQSANITTGTTGGAVLQLSARSGQRQTCHDLTTQGGMQHVWPLEGGR